MLEITLYGYTIRDNGTNGRFILVALASGPVHGNGGRDRGESGESAARMKIIRMVYRVSHLLFAFSHASGP